MNCVILIEKSVEISEFVAFWRRAYDDSDEKYAEHIKNHPKSEKDIKALYEWKNGGKLSRLKQKSLETKIIPNLNTINSLSNDFKIDKFNTEFKDVSAIWRYFLLHIIRPDKYPMLDQYVMRSYYYLKDGNNDPVIPSKNSEKEDFYIKYLDFFNDIVNDVKSDNPRKDLDEALWAFGKFLKSTYRNILFNNV